MTLNDNRSIDFVGVLAFAAGGAVIVPSLAVAAITVAAVLVKLFT